MVFNPGEVLEAAMNSIKAGKVYLIEKRTYADKIIDHLTRLNDEDRRMRFGVNLPDQRIQHYVNDSIKVGDFLFAVFGNEGEIVAFLHMARDARDSFAYELGLSVNLDDRKNGYASALFEKAVNFAKTLGAKRIYTYCLSENKAMQHLAKKNQLKIALEHGDVTGQLQLSDRTAVEIVNGLIDFATTEQMMIIDRASMAVIQSFLAQFKAFSDVADSFRRKISMS